MRTHSAPHNQAEGKNRQQKAPNQESPHPNHNRQTPHPSVCLSSLDHGVRQVTAHLIPSSKFQLQMTGEVHEEATTERGELSTDAAPNSGAHATHKCKAGQHTPRRLHRRTRRTFHVAPKQTTTRSTNLTKSTKRKTRWSRRLLLAGAAAAGHGTQKPRQKKPVDQPALSGCGIRFLNTRTDKRHHIVGTGATTDQYLRPPRRPSDCSSPVHPHFDSPLSLSTTARNS